jgi:thioredoxin-related protein
MFIKVVSGSPGNEIIQAVMIKFCSIFVCDDSDNLVIKRLNRQTLLINKTDSLLYIAIFQCLSLVLVFLLSGIAEAENFDDSEILHIDYPDWFIDNAFKDFPDDLNNALSNGKKGLMVLFTTEGCSYCDRFIKKSLGDPEIAKVVQRNFDTVGLEIFNDANMVHPDGTPTNVANFAESEGVEFSPTLLFFGKEGKTFLKLVGYQSPQKFKNIMLFFEERQPGETFKSYLKRKSSALNEMVEYELQPDALFQQPPFDLERSTDKPGKPALVIFEGSGCKNCKNFHENVLSDAAIRQSLQAFDVVQLDKNNQVMKLTTPAGDEMTAAQWYQQTGFSQLPALMFFNEYGEKVLQTDALVLNQRLMNSLNFVLERAYEKGWTYQRFARSKGIERYMNQGK